jgi:ferritin-like metal-binding protein YciE
MANDILPFQNINNFELTQLFESSGQRIKKIFQENNFGRHVRDTLECSGSGMHDCQYYYEDEAKHVLKSISKGVTVLNLNIRSLDKHLNELLTMVQNIEHVFDFITLTEIGKKNIDIRANMVCDMYNFEYVTPKVKRCGGSGILIKNSISYHIRSDLNLLNENVEDVWIESILNGQKIILGCVYRHPGTNITGFNDELERCLHKINNEGCLSIISGDFNIDGLKTNTDKHTSEFYECMMLNTFIPSITVPTRITENSMTLIDNIFINMNKKTMNSVVSGNIFSDITDHLPNFAVVCDSCAEGRLNCRPKVRLFGEKNIGKFTSDLSNMDWSQFYQNANVDELLNIFYSRYSCNFEKNFPLKRLSRKRAKDKIWITAGLRKCIRHKADLYRQFLNHPTAAKKEKYKKYKNMLTKMIRNAEIKYYNDKIDSSKKNIRALWQIYGPLINPTKCKKKVEINSILENGIVLKDKHEIANALNDHFVNIGPKLTKNTRKDKSPLSYLQNNMPGSVYIWPTDPSEISKIISELQTSKAGGDDQLSAKLIKANSKLFSELFTHLINKSIETSKYPEKLKLGKVIPVHKRGSKQDPSNYRPISLLSMINKIVEKVLYKRLYQYFENQQVLHKYQFGFRKNYSTISALIEIVEQLRYQKENKNITIGIYLDLTKAFDLVNHSILLNKLESYGVRGSTNKLIKSYLENRKQYTQVNAQKSKLKTIECGVPQGSVLGPLLFLIYFNDIQNCTKAPMRLFADDANIFISCKDPIHLRKIAEQCLTDIKAWLNLNRLILSEDKTQYSIFMPCKRKVPTNLNEIQIGKKTIIRTDSCKYLGVILDDKLSFDGHIMQLCKDLTKVIYSFRVIKDWVPHCEKLKLYYAYFHSKVQYGIEVYGTAAKKLINKIDILQHKAIKALYNLEPLTPTRSLLAQFKLLTTKDLYSLKIATFVHKHQNNSLPCIFSTYYSKLASNESYPNTRNRNKLLVPKAKNENGMKMINCVGARIWNRLVTGMSDNLVNLSSNAFSRKVKDHYVTNFMA